MLLIPTRVDDAKELEASTSETHIRQNAGKPDV